MAKNSLVVPCCQNPEYYWCISLDYGLHSHPSVFGHGASITVLGCLKKRGEEERIRPEIIN